MIDEATVEHWMREANPIRDLGEVDPDELASAVDVVHTRRAAVMQAPTQHPSRTTTPAGQRRRKVWAFAAAFILVLAAIGVAALAIRGGYSRPVTDKPMAPETVTTAPPTTSAPTATDVQSLTWSRLPQDGAVFDPTTGTDRMSSVTAGGPGFVAVGTSELENSNGEADFDAVVWVSEDGLTWSRLNVGGPGRQEMNSVTAGGPGLVAVGFEVGSEGRVGAAWTSENGISWSKANVQTDTTHVSVMEHVRAGGPGLVAIGSGWEKDSSGQEALVGAIWTSIDGITWNRAPQDPGVLGWPAGVTVGGPGLVAVGVDHPDGNAAVWTSPDGLNWARVPHDEAVLGGVGGQWMNDVVAGGPGFVAVGADEPGFPREMGGWRAAVWTSPDGFTWTRVPHDPEVFGGGAGDEQSMQAVISVGSQLVAVGGGNGNIIWTSPDGVTWNRSDIPGDGAMNSLVASDSGLIAVGQEGGAAAVWIGTED
jgi:hypothetical protein